MAQPEKHEKKFGSAEHAKKINVRSDEPQIGVTNRKRISPAQNFPVPARVTKTAPLLPDSKLPDKLFEKYCHKPKNHGVLLLQYENQALNRIG